MKKRRLRGLRHKPVAPAPIPPARIDERGRYTEITDLKVVQRHQALMARVRNLPTAGPDLTDEHNARMREQGLIP